MTKRKKADIKNFTVVIYRTALKSSLAVLLSLQGIPDNPCPCLWAFL